VRAAFTVLRFPISVAVLQFMLLAGVLGLHLRTNRRTVAAGVELTEVATRAADPHDTLSLHRAVLPLQLAEYRDSAMRAERASWYVGGGVLLSSILLVGALALARDHKARADRFEELDRLKRDFVANVSHDLKTPIASLQSTTDVLLEELPGPLTDRQRRLLSISQDSNRRLGSMVGKLLDMSRLESRLMSVPVPVDMRGIARAAVERANDGHIAASCGVKVALDCGKDRVLALGDGDNLDRLLDNLIENAMKFSPRAATVRVALVGTDETVELTVADCGPGIADADKQRVFERFHQTPAGRAVLSRGVGLGLAICRHIVQEAGGRIWITDNVPLGTIVHVTLATPVCTDTKRSPAGKASTSSSARPVPL
jgi:signal transduction histidine kinase